MALVTCKLHTRVPHKIHISTREERDGALIIAPFGDAYEKIGTIQRRLAWPLHKDDTLFQSGRPTGLNIYFFSLSLASVIEQRSSRAHWWMLQSSLRMFPSLTPLFLPL